MTTMQLELISSSSWQRLDVLIVPDQGLDAWDFVESGLSLYEAETEIIVPDMTFEELRRKVTIGLEQAHRGEFVEGSGEEVIRRALQRGLAQAREERRRGTP